jgi:hypothetical protein
MTSEERKDLYKGQGSTLVLVIAKSGRGKSASLRNLPEESSYIINVMGKPLPFPGAMKRFKVGENMSYLPDAITILSKMKEVSANAKFDRCIIDDGQYVMASEFMLKAMVKGYDKFTIMAKNIWEIMTQASLLRDGLKVYILTHEEETEKERKMKTLGKLLDDKITPEGLSTIVLFADVTTSGDGRQYVFQTQSDGITSAKSPMGMFPLTIANDLWLVDQRIDEYYQGVELKDSKIDFGNLPSLKTTK